MKRERLIEILEFYNGTSGSVNPIADLILDEIESGRTGDGVREALTGISDDYMTSEKHHPGYVLPKPPSPHPPRPGSVAYREI